MWPRCLALPGYYPWIISTVVAWIFIERGSSAKLPYSTVYLQDTCNCVIGRKLRCNPYHLQPTQDGAGHVALSRNPVFDEVFYCEFTIQAPVAQKVQLTLNNVTMPDTYECKGGSLTLWDGIPGERGVQVASVCGQMPKIRTFHSTTNVMTLHYRQGPDILRDSKSVNITYTYIHVHQPPDAACDETNEFMCKNTICISQPLKCDGYQNCPDGSDESLEWNVCGKFAKSDPIVGVVVGCTVAGILCVGLVAAIIYTIKRRSNRDHRQGLANAAPDLAGPVADCSHQSLAAPDLTRDLVERARLTDNNSDHVNGDISQSDVSSITYAASRDLAPPSYSSLFPDL